jgi:hypothetical protein
MATKRTASDDAEARRAGERTVKRFRGDVRLISHEDGTQRLTVDSLFPEPDDLYVFFVDANWQSGESAGTYFVRGIVGAKLYAFATQTGDRSYTINTAAHTFSRRWIIGTLLDRAHGHWDAHWWLYEACRELGMSQAMVALAVRAPHADEIVTTNINHVFYCKVRNS